MKKHKTKSIILKQVDVDIEIIPVVDWLNSFDSVFTKFSCEGDKNYKPYIVFSCDSTKELAEITKLIGNCGRIYIRQPLDLRLIDFSIEFSSKKELKYFIEVINTKKEYYVRIK